MDESEVLKGAGSVGGADGGERPSELPLLEVGPASSGGADAASPGVELLVAPESDGLRPTPLDVERLRASVDLARRAGDGASLDAPELPDEIADIVVFTLRARADARPNAATARPFVVRPDEIGALVERALIEVGAAGTARAYIVGRDRRARAGTERAGPADARERLPLVRGARGAEPFRAHRIVAALVEETGLLPAEAERVAERVSKTLAGAGLPSVSTALVRELVAGELLGLGLRDALARHDSIGLPRHDLLRHFERAPSPGTEPRVERVPAAAFRSRIAEEIVGRWAVADLVSDETADAHARGDLELVGLGSFHAPIVRAVDARLLAPRPSGPAGRAQLAGRAAELARGTTSGLYLEGLVGADAVGDDDPLEHLFALGAAGQAAGRAIELSGADVSDGGARAGAWVDALARGLEHLEDGARTAPGLDVPRLYVTWTEITAALATGDADETARAADAAERCLRAGRIVPVWCGDPERVWVGPGLTRRSGDRGALCLDAAIALNLPRLARRAGPWREEAFLEELHGALVHVREAARQRAQFVARARATFGATPAEVGRTAVVPVGLREALRILGDGLARADQGARVLGFLADALARPGGGAQRSASAGGPVPELGAAPVGRAGERFARLDAALAREARQPRLFGDLPAPEDEFGGAYGVGYGDLRAEGDPGRVVHRAEALAVLLGTVRAGALDGGDPGPGDAARAAGADAATVPGDKIEGVEAPAQLLEALAKRPRLAAWGRFAAIRSSAPPEGVLQVETTLF
ncbi:MAG: hypothetical protein AAFU73_14025 [Planctomycetota bacterium]